MSDENTCGKILNLIEQMNLANEEIKKLNQQKYEEYDAQIRARVAERNAVNYPSANVADYPSFSTLRDGIDGDSRARQFQNYCSSTAFNGYPVGSYVWDGTQIPDGSGRAINWCLDDGRAGSCQTKGTCRMNPTVIASWRADAQRKINAINDDIRNLEARRDSSAVPYKPVLNRPICCQNVDFAGLNANKINVDNVTQTCSIIEDPVKNVPVPTAPTVPVPTVPNPTVPNPIVPQPSVPNPTIPPSSYPVNKPVIVPQEDDNTVLIIMVLLFVFLAITSGLAIWYFMEDFSLGNVVLDTNFVNSF